MVIIDIESNNTSVGGLTLDPAGMHCPSWDDAFVSSFVYKLIDRFRYIVNVCIDIVQRIDSDNSDLCTPMTELPYLHARAFKYFSPRPV